MGFNGKAAIHPSQLEVIKNSFIPNEDEIEEAKEIIKKPLMMPLQQL